MPNWRCRRKLRCISTRPAGSNLDDELDTARSGLHGASLGGTWQSIVNGFAGVRVSDGQLSFKPLLPRKWRRLAFRLHFRDSEIAVTLTRAGLDLHLLSGNPLTVLVDGETRAVTASPVVPDRA